MLYDLDYTFSFEANLNSASHNTLAHATRPTGTDWPNPSWTTLLMRKLLDVPEFRKRFINRLADMMNAEFLPATTEARLDTMKALFAPEMPRHIARWAGTGNVIPSTSTWQGNIETVRTFLKNRTPNVRSHLRAQFGLAAERELELTITPPEGGRLKLNSLLIQGTSWKGMYFPGVPVQLDALPAPDFRFSGWEGVPASVDALNGRITLDPAEARPVARFEPDTGAVNRLVIHEINYHAPEANDPGDWVELHNAYEVPVDVSGWVLRDSEEGHAFVIPEGTVMEPGAFLVLCADKTTFSAKFPQVVNALGNLNFSLGNSGDRVRLFNTRKELVDEVEYDDASPWPAQADGGGPTLELARPGIDNAVASNWRGSISNLGSPGAPNGPALSEAQAPSLTAAMNASELSIRLVTEPARTYLIQYSTDLSEWTDWRLLVGDGVERSVAGLPSSRNVEFFRVKVLR